MSPRPAASSAPPARSAKSRGAGISYAARQASLFEPELPRVAVSREVLRTELHDKAIDYCIGEYQGRVLIVEDCPACGARGAQLTPTTFIHRVVLFERGGKTQIDKSNACDTNARHALGHGPLLIGGGFFSRKR